MLLDLHDTASLRNWLRALASRRPYLVKDGWPEKLHTEPLIVDMSKVRWVEPGAVVRVILFVEAALFNGIEVVIRLPFARPTYAESLILSTASNEREKKEKHRNISRYIERRADAAAVLEALRFRQALAAEHLQKVSNNLIIDERYDWSIQTPENISANHPSAEEGAEQGNASALVSPWYFRTVYPLQWIPAPRETQGRQMIDHLAQIDLLAEVITHPSGRVDAPDARTLSHFFIKELVENTVDHAGREYALVVAWSRPHNIALFENEILPCEKAFAAWSRGYPLVEIIVGDSGVGIPATLREEYRKYTRSLGYQLVSGLENDRILAWAFDKHSSRKPLEARRGMRGLYRASRIVQKYSGCITLQSESSYVGLDCSERQQHSINHSEKLARSPGTIAHVRLPVMLAAQMPASNRVAPLKSAMFDILDLVKLTSRTEPINWNSPDEALAYVQRQVEKKCRELSATNKQCCLIVDFGFANIERRILERLLDDLMQLSHPVAIVAANVSAPDWDSCVETVASLEQQINADKSNVGSASAEDTARRDAILFRHADGKYLWVGTPPHSRLSRLWEEGRLTLDELEEQLPDIEVRSRFLRDLQEANHVCRITHEAVVLHFNRADVDQQLLNYLERTLKEFVLRTGAPGIIEGMWFRTPSLELVPRFINVEKLINHFGIKRCMAALAQKAASVDWVAGIQHNLELVAGWPTSRELIEAFQHGLAIALSNRVNVTVHQIGKDDVLVIEENRVALIFTDLISSGNMIGRLQRQLMRAGKRDVGIITIIDARPPISQMSAEQAMTPVLSFFRIENAPLTMEPAHVINISPGDPWPEEERGIREYEIKADRIWQMIQSADALYFQHVVRPNGRHFCLYLDALRLLGAEDSLDPYNISSTGDEIVAAFVSTIVRWLRPDERIDLILFPYFPQMERPSAAQILAVKLSEVYETDTCPVSPGRSVVKSQLPRKPTQAPAIDLFDEGDPIEPQTVLVVDWGALTGKGIRDLVRSANSVGARRILTIIFANQLESGEEASFPEVYNIEAWGDGNQSTPCQVQVTFLTRFHTHSYDTLHCPYCRQLSRLQSEERFLPSPLLRRYVAAARNRLRHLSLTEAWKAHQADLPIRQPGERTNAEAVLLIAKLREQLDAAKDQTAARFHLYNKIVDIQSLSQRGEDFALFQRGCLMRLLASEWLLLKEEPLTLPKVRRLIAELSVETIKDTSRIRQERQDAIIVLRTISKDTFASHLEALFVSVVEDPTLVSQLLYCAFTYLQRDYLIVARLRLLVEALKRCLVHSKPLLGLPDPVAALEVRETLHVLYQYGAYVIRFQETGGNTTAQIWNQLREEFGNEYQPHHPLCEAFNDLQMGVLEHDLKRLALQPWDAIRDAWRNACERVLIERILPLMGKLKKVFEGIDAKLMIGKENAEALAWFAEGRGFMEMASLTSTLERFAHDPQSINVDEFKALAQIRDWLWEKLIDPGELEPGGTRNGGSALIRFLQHCPVDIKHVLRSVLQNYDLNARLAVQIEPHSAMPDATPVFCHEHVLYACLSEIFANVIKHNQAAESDDLRIPVLVTLHSSGTGLCCTIYNQGTLIPTSGGGRGLVTVAERLLCYGATIQRLAPPSLPWTFGIEICLQKG